MASPISGNKKSGAGLWEKAKKIIPGGNQLLSKRAEQFLPGKWPAYFDKAKGIEVTGLEGERYLDFSLMSVGACVLGYANKGVNKAVQKAIEKGNMATLNCPEEVELAEKLIELHPWAGQVRFSKAGGEACAIAIRIARAATKKDGVAFCGYHGWNDWYLAANLSNSQNLDNQLLPGLTPSGVPSGLAGTAFPFVYGDIKSFEKILSDHEGKIGTIIMEVVRYKPINLSFLKQVQEIAKQRGVILIFDEVTSGFRERLGGLHMQYGLQPDMIVLGKALGNGYPISAIVGKKEVMNFAQETFISSTFWTDRIGFVAALEVIRQYQKENVSAHLVAMGKLVKEGWQNIFNRLQLNIEVAGVDAVPTMIIKETEALKIKTIFTQEMLKRGYLASTTVFISSAHSKDAIRQYLKNAAEVFELIKTALNQNQLDSKLEGPVCHSHFSRLN